MHRRDRLTSILMVGAAALAAASPAAAQPRDFRIPAGDLAAALDAYARQSGDQLIYSTEQVRGARTAGVTGKLEPGDALQHILGGTSFVVRRERGGGVVVDRNAAGTGPARDPAAQPSPTSGETQAIEEVIVTAQRREERLHDVPISATVLGSAALEQRQIKDVNGLFGSVPSLSIAPGLGERHGLFIGLRGLSAQASQIGSDPAVGVYIDGLYLARTTGVDVAMVDVDRVEVLRGPQGILFGRNTIGGALNITTVKPKDEFDGLVRMEAGNFGRTEFTGIVNVPVSDQLAARVVYRRERDDGYGKDTYLGSRLSDNDYDYARLSLRYTPTAKVEALLTADWFRSDTNSVLYKLLTYRTANPGGGAQALALAHGDTLANYVGGDIFTNQANLNPIVRQEFYSVTGTVSADLGWATLKSISGYRQIRSNRGADPDGTPYDIFGYYGALSPQHQVSEELQAFGDAAGGRLQWIVGGFYFQERGANIGTVLQNYSTTAPINTNTVHVDFLDAKNSSLSAFGQLTYEILPDLQLTGGVRYVEDSRQGVNSFRFVNGVTGAVTCLLPQPTAANPANVLPGFNAAACTAPAPKVKFRYTPWSVGLKYKISEDAMAYAKATRGYRSGGYPNPSFTNAAQYVPFDPETTLTYEVGSKLNFLDGRASLNLAAYHTDYDNIQQTVTGVGVGGILVQVIQNVGSARIWGGEADASVRVGRLRLNAGVGLIDPKYTKGPLVGIGFINTSKTTWSLAADYPVETSVGRLDLHMDYAYHSTIRFFTSIGLTPAEVQATQQTGVGLLNGSADLTINHVTLSLWGRNLADEHYMRGSQNAAASVGIVSGVPAEPRTYGVAATYRF